LALRPDALLGQLLVQLGQALKVHLVEALQVHGRVQGMGDGVKLRHSLAHKHGHQAPLVGHLLDQLKPRGDRKAHAQGRVLVNLPLLALEGGHGLLEGGRGLLEGGLRAGRELGQGQAPDQAKPNQVPLTFHGLWTYAVLKIPDKMGLR
jgi:hypothetical protein